MPDRQIPLCDPRRALLLAMVSIGPGLHAGNALHAATPPLSEASAATGDETPTAPISCKVQAPALGALDKAQNALYRAICGSTLWFDGFFGEPSLYEGAGQSYGRLNVGTLWDQRDGFDPQLRLRARVTLPALEQRSKLLLGVGNAEELIDGTADSYAERADQTLSTGQDNELLLGLGYSPSPDPRRGLDFEGGLKLGFPVNPYVATNYRWYSRLSEQWYLRLRLRGFWIRDERFGTSFTSSLDHSLNPAVLLRWSAFTKVSGQTEGLDWRTRFTAYQGITDNQALSYAVYVRGETEREVSLSDYGVELRYRRRAFRQWFFVELISGLSWPRDTRTEDRVLNPGAGLEFEMHFGGAP
jgi:hypothetical protein